MDVSRWCPARVAHEIGGLADMLGDKRGFYAETMINEEINGSAFMQLKLEDLEDIVGLRRLTTKVSYRSMGTTGDPVPSGHRDGPDHHFTG